MVLLKSVLLFPAAGLCEIGGGYLIRHWLKGRFSLSVSLIGAALLVLYGVLPTFQPTPQFGRVYAAYGGVFVVMSLLWDWTFDDRVPDKPDAWGALLCLTGVAVVMYWPRK
jgi:small multidrug resistance family-3 protein